jgi:hypothetical protein
MDLPVFRKGLELVSSQLNKLSQGIRAAQITSVIGGSFTRTPAGTTLVIAPQSGGGGGSATPYCAFKVTDDSNPAETKLFIKIQQDKIDGRYPDGMTGSGNFTKEIPEQWVNGGTTWVGVYIIIRVNELGKIHSQDTSIRVQLSEFPLDSFAANQTFLISQVNISRDSNNKPSISFISNSCPLISVLQNNGFCPFEVSDIFPKLEFGEKPKIQIQNGKIEGRTPSGMHAGGKYELEIPNNGEWHSVYCVLATDNDGNILPGDTSITFAIFNDYKQNTSRLQYVLIGEVSTSYDGFGKRYISFIQNLCIIPAAEKLPSCWYRATIAGDNIVSILQMPLPTNNPSAPYIWPYGMPGGQFLLEVTGSGFIYMAVLFDGQTYLVSQIENAVTIFYSNILVSNTDVLQYILLAVVTMEGGQITNIYNVCTQPPVNPCMLLFWA